MRKKIMTSIEPDPSNATQALIHNFFQLYPGEAAVLLNKLPPDEILRLLQAEPTSRAAHVLVRLNPDIAVELLNMMDDAYFVRLFENIDPDRGAFLLAHMEKEVFENRLGLLPSRAAQELKDLLAYPPDSAGNLMDSRVLTFHGEETVEDVLSQLRKIRKRRIMDICLVDEEGLLIAVIPLQDVAVSEPHEKLGQLAKRDPISIQAMSPREDVVQLLEDRKLASLPVVDFNGKILGIIRYDALVTVAQQDASEDLQAMFGAGRDERALSKVSFAIRKRLPWLEINLATAFLASIVVGLFEDTIARITALAVFLPVVAGQSGNTGSQALAVTMRGLALKEVRIRHWLRIVRKEALVGLVNGVVIAITTSAIVYMWMNSLGLSVVIGIAMVFSMVIAGMSGAVIPVTLKAFGQDPAQSSSIILTTVTDVFGFLSFLGLAQLLADVFGIA
jgi:magnesium transporter